MYVKKIGLTLNYPEGPNYYFKVSKMWRTQSGNGFIGFASNYHTGETFRIWSKNNFYLTGSVVSCRKRLDIDCFVVDDHISEQICDLDDFLKEYQLNQYCIPIVNPSNTKQLSILEEFEEPIKNLYQEDPIDKESVMEEEIIKKDADSFYEDFGGS